MKKGYHIFLALFRLEYEFGKIVKQILHLKTWAYCFHVFTSKLLYSWFCIYGIPKILGYGVEEGRISNIFSFSKVMIEKGLGETFHFPLMPGYIKNIKPIKGYSLIWNSFSTVVLSLSM